MTPHSSSAPPGAGAAQPDVVIIGAGPVGLALACELRLAGISVVVLERLLAIDPTIKAGSLGPLAGEALARRGFEPAMAAVEAEAMQKMHAMMRSMGATPPSGPPRNAQGKVIGGHFSGLFLIDQEVQAEPWRRHRGVGQQALEDMLGRRAAELGASVQRGVTVTGFDDRGDSVAITAVGAEGEVRLTARYLVGCDGGRSFVRKHAGFAFPGTAPTITGYQALVELADPEKLLPLGWRRTPVGMLAFGPVPGRILTVEFDGTPGERDAPVTRDELQAALRRVSGSDVTITEVRSATRWTDNARQVTAFRSGRVLVAGDAAHVHSPFGGQGLNLGICDAMNLGWKLAATIRGQAPGGLLDTYTTERHPVAARVLANTRAQVALMRPGPEVDALRDLVADLLAIDDVNRYFGAMLGGLDVRYPIAGDHPMTGRPWPDLAITLADGTPTGTAAVMHDGRALLLDLGAGDALTRRAAGLADRVQVIRARSARSDLAAVLVRPDGFVAWAAAPGTIDPTGLDLALATWFVAAT